MTADDRAREEIAVRLSPDGELVAIRRGPNDWRVSNGGHYRDQHVADWTPLVPEPTVRALMDQAAAKALENAADDWQRGAWADAPRRTDRIEERIANAQHVTNWLRDRARALTAEHERETRDA